MCSSRLIAVCALLAAALCNGSGRAADAERPAAPTPLSPALVSVLSYGLRNPACLQWTDRCIVCTQNGCSNIGIACQPQEIVCTDPAPAAAKENAK